MDSGHLHYEKRSNYNNKVLLGNWVEDQFTYVKDPVSGNSTYREDYNEKNPQSNWMEFVWNQKIKNEGLGARILMDHGKETYLDNMSSLYDLSYKHFPKWYQGPIHRKWLSGTNFDPNGDEYVQTYGNLTNYGLLERKKEDWRCEKQDPRLSPTTIYQDSYLKPDKKYLVKERFAVPKANSTNRIYTNFQSRALMLRHRFSSNVVPNDQLVPYPVKLKCNPITWECNQLEKPSPIRCIKIE